MVDDEGMKFASVAEEQAMQKQAVDLVAAYLKVMPADEPRPLAVEAALEAPLVNPITGEDLGIPLVGIVDLILDGTTAPPSSTSRPPPVVLSHWRSLTRSSFRATATCSGTSSSGRRGVCRSGR